MNTQELENVLTRTQADLSHQIQSEFYGHKSEVAILAVQCSLENSAVLSNLAVGLIMRMLWLASYYGLSVHQDLAYIKQLAPSEFSRAEACQHISLQSIAA